MNQHKLLLIIIFDFSGMTPLPLSFSQSIQGEQATAPPTQEVASHHYLITYSPTRNQSDDKNYVSTCCSTIHFMNCTQIRLDSAQETSGCRKPSPLEGRSEPPTSCLEESTRCHLIRRRTAQPVAHRQILGHVDGMVRSRYQ